MLTPRSPKEPDFQERLRELAPDCCPVVAYGALVPRARARPAGARLGQPALLAAARLARRGARAARRPARRRGHRRDDLPAGGGPGHRPGARHDDRAGTADRHLRRPARAPRDRRRRAARRDARRPGVRAAVAVPQPADGVSLAPKVTVDDARVDWSAPALRVDRLVRACTPAPGAWTTFRDKRVKLGPVTATDERLRARRASTADGWSAPPPPRCGWARCGPRARARWPPPTGCAGCGRARGAVHVTPPAARRSAAPHRPDAPPADAEPRRAAYDVLKAVREDDAYANLVLPGAAARARHHRSRRRAGDRAGVRRAARPGAVRRGPAGLRRPAAGQGRPAGARRAAPRCAPAAAHPDPAARRRLRDRRPGPPGAVGRAGRLRQRRAAQGRGEGPRHLGRRARARRRPAGRAGARAQPPALDRQRLPRRARRRPVADRRGARRRRRPPRGAPRRPAARPGRPRRRSPAAPPVPGRRARCGCPRATPARSPPSATAGPACRTRAASSSRSRWPPQRSTARTRSWVDLCAGPGGKAALLDVLAEERGARLVAFEAQHHRARLVRRSGPSASSPPTAARRRSRRAPPTGCCSTRPAAVSARCAAGPRRAGAGSRRTCPASPGCRASCSPPAPGCCDPAACWRTSPARRTWPRPSCPSATCCAGTPGSSSSTPGRCCPACPTSATARPCSCGRTCTAPTRCS